MWLALLPLPHILARPSGEWVRVPWVTSNCSSVPISTVIAPQSQPIQDSAAALTCGRGPGLYVGLLSFTFKSHDMVLLAACIRKQGKAELRKVSEQKWPKGLDMRQKARVYVYKIGLNG